MAKTNELIGIWFLKAEVKGNFSPKHHIQKHKLTMTDSLSNKFDLTVIGRY